MNDSGTTNMQGDFAVEVRGLVKKFENKIAVNKVDLTARNLNTVAKLIQMTHD